MHLTCVYDSTLASNNVSVYADTVMGTGGSARNLTEAINFSGSMIIASNTADFQGYLKDFRWWTNKALTTTEITQVYEDDPSAPTPNYWLKMDEGTGNPVDAITGTKIGTLTNGPTWIVTSQSTSISKYDILALASSIITSKYDIMQLASSAIISLYDILQLVQLVASSEIISRYNIRQLASSTMISKYNIMLLAPSMPGGIYFDGIDDSITLGSPTILNNLDNLTVSLWIYPSSLGPSTPHLFTKFYANANSFIFFFSGNFILNWRTVNNALVNVTSTSTYIGTTGINRWYHVLVTFNRSTGLQRLYVDNVLRDSDTNTGVSANIMGSTGAMSINGGGGGAKWGGLIKDFRVFRSDLTQTDIDKIYNNAVDAPVPDYWLKMNEGVGNPVDNIGGILIGTLTNGARWFTTSALPLISKYNIRRFASSSIVSKYDIIKKAYKLINIINNNRFTSKEGIPRKSSFMRTLYDRNWGDNDV